MRARAVPTVVDGIRYRSKMEARIGPALIAAGATYEKAHLQYTKANAWYTPDFELPNGILIEVKGLFTPADRTKMIAVKRAHPGRDIRFVLATPEAYLTKAKSATQADWCRKHGFPFAKGDVPAAWLQ